jgi:alpha-1,6-mannosyltransferase
VAALAIMLAAGLLRSSWMPPALALPSVGPPFELGVHIPFHQAIWPLWVAGALATFGVAAGLVAVRRGQPVPVRAILIAAGLAILALILVPPVGTTDPLDYAVYGHIVAIGHNPYTMTPYRFRLATHLTGVPLDWQHTVSVYGPLATSEQYLAARLGGSSLATTVFWLKLANAVAFVAVAYAANRLFRGDRAARVRAHLLWTANPLIIWATIAGGHLDVLAAALGVAGLLMLDRRGLQRPIAAAIGAGICIGAAADIKADFALFGLAVVWALWRKPRELAASAAGALVVLVPSYALAGTYAIKALTIRSSTGYGWGFWKFIFWHLHIPLHLAVPTALVLLVPVTWLALTRLPAGFEDRPAVRAALALSLAWLLVWPHQFAWYSIMAICVLVLYPASRLDWVALAWLAILTIADMPGLGTGQSTLLAGILQDIEGTLVTKIEPVILLGALVALVVWCRNRRWNAAATELPATWVAVEPAGTPAA